MTHEEFNRIKSLDTAIRRGSKVLEELVKYKADKTKQGMMVVLNHETRRTVIDIVFPEIENEVLSLLEQRYNQLMSMWVDELRRIRDGH